MKDAETTVPAGIPESPLAFIRHFARPYRFLFIGSLAAAAASGILSLGPALVIYAIVASAGSDDATTGGMAMTALAGLCAALGHLVLAVVSTLGGHKTAFAIQRDLRLRLVGSIVEAPVSRVEGRAGEIKKTALADVDRLEGLLAHVLPDMASGLAAAVAGSIVLVMVDWRLFLASLALLPIAVVAQIWMYGGRSELFERWNATEAKANAALLSYVRGIATLRAFNRQASTLENVRAAIHELRDLAVIITQKSRYSYSLFDGVLSTNLLVVLPVALLLHGAGTIGDAGFVLAVTLGASLIAPLHKVVFATMIAARSAVAVSRIRELLQTPPLPGEGTTGAPAGNAITLEGVAFSYPDGREVLRGIDLRIAEGETVAIVGPSGTGKSTLARLLLRLEDPTSGRICLGDIDMREIEPSALRLKLAAVFQDSVLFHGTIGDNIALSATRADHGGLLRVLRDARADDIAGDGEATLRLAISDRGQRLSGGEKQRVAIARALLKDAPVLLLDEATASIDAASEAAIQEAVERTAQGRTVIVIAHRLRSIRDADRIVVLNGGTVEAIGKHDELLGRSATYRRLHEAQQRAAGWNLAGPRGIAGREETA
ncbi:MAG: ABC transporter ATP-binding protein/permease [Rhizobiaceae bacterium]|nr:ABC transporter ATP-binding protein/permease [Rhizobiaceae bacterium]